MNTQEIDRQCITGINQFAFRIFSQLSKQNSQNLLISPLSLAIVMALLHNGAAGETEQELAELLGIKNSNFDAVNAAYAALHNRLIQSGKGLFSIANSLWGHEGLAFNPNFIQSSQSYYSTDVFNINFADPGVLRTINNWVKQKTNEKINDIIKSDDVNANTTLIFLNAIYFKGKWKYQFNKANTQEVPFIFAEGRSSPHSMMSQSGSFDYYQSDNLQAITLPYDSSDISMIIFLPSEKNSLSRFLERLDLQKFQKWRSQSSRMQGHLILPRFTVDYEASLINTLRSLGLDVALSPNPNYQNMGEVAAPISEIRHKVFMEINEEGTEASAATSVVMQRSIIQKFSMVINRPFFCLIQDEQTGIILFMGAVWEPS